MVKKRKVYILPVHIQTKKGLEYTYSMRFFRFFQIFEGAGWRREMLAKEMSKIIDYNSNKLEDERVFDMLQSEKLESLKASIEDIQEAIRMRKKLSEEVIALFNNVIIETDNFIIKLHEVDRRSELIRGEQMKIKQKQMEFESKKIEEQVSCWKDIALLKKELREHLAEFRERENRSTMLDSILDSNI